MLAQLKQRAQDLCALRVDEMDSNLAGASPADLHEIKARRTDLDAMFAAADRRYEAALTNLASITRGVATKSLRRAVAQ